MPTACAALGGDNTEPPGDIEDWRTPVTRTLGVAQTDKRPEKCLMLKDASALTNALRNGATDSTREATSCFSMLPMHQKMNVLFRDV